MTVEQAREIIELLDLIVEGKPSPGDVFVLKGAVLRVVRTLTYDDVVFIPGVNQ